ncbi:MAG: hypothetical protein ACRC3B_11455 [Bacteroidia bacterium]
MINELITLNFEFRNNSASVLAIQLLGDPSDVSPDTQLQTSVAANPGDRIPLTVQLKDVTTELKFEIHFSADFVKLRVAYFEGWEITEKLLDDKLHYECTYTTTEQVTAHKFTIPVKPPIGILIVGTTDPVLPPQAG